MQVIGWEIQCFCQRVVERHLNKLDKYLFTSFLSTTVRVHVVSFGTVNYLNDS